MDTERTPSPTKFPSLDNSVSFMTPSLSPMKLSPTKKGEGSGIPDSIDLLALMPPNKSRPRGAIPFERPRSLAPAFQSPSQTGPSQRIYHASSDPYGSEEDATTPNTIPTTAGDFSSISSISSALSTQLQHHFGANQEESSSPLPHSGLHRLPSLPLQASSSIRTHVSEFNERGRTGIKRSASFNKSSDPIKRAPSYGNIKEPANPFTATKSNLASSTTTIYAGDQIEMGPTVPPKTLGHKRERSDSSVETGYDTEDVPPSSAPSSGLISQRSPVKMSYETPPKPLPGSPLKPAVELDKVFTPSPSPTKMLEPPTSSSKKGFLSSPAFDAVKKFGKKRSLNLNKDKGADSKRDRSVTASPSPSPAPSLVFPSIGSPGEDVPTSPTATDFFGSPHSAAAPSSPFVVQFPPVSPISSRFPDGLGLGLDTERDSDAMEVDETPTQLPSRLGSRHFRSSESPMNELSGSGAFGIPGTPGRRRSSVEPRREGEPVRKRVKTDELAERPALPDIGSPVGGFL